MVYRESETVELKSVITEDIRIEIIASTAARVIRKMVESGLLQQREKARNASYVANVF